MPRWTRATGPAGAAGNAAGNAACRIAIASAFAGAMPAKLGVARMPALVEAEEEEEPVSAAFADAAAWLARLLALCAEMASQAPITITKGITKPAKTAKTFQPRPRSG